ncbi:hypothetical protein OLMES_5532 [Oleiphilus messinensis]|uniref:Uncharacterized protein n=1 Tax=Oleiphilus messinensis TaxID=141451 RepID=A0A1Y0IG91_9GAMM|nr:hypothetical protein OLMES_5532 [Oleiphilus messinensis]
MCVADCIIQPVFVKHGDADPNWNISLKQAISVAPVVFGELDIIVKYEMVRHTEQIKVAAPRKITWL